MNWTNPGEADAVLRHVDAGLGLNTKGQVTLGFDFNHFASLVEMLADCASWSPEIPAHQRISLSREAVIAARKASDLSTRSVLKRLAAAARQYCNLPLHPFVLMTTVSLRYAPWIRPARIDQSTITFSRGIPRGFTMPERAKSARLHFGDPPRSYAIARVSIRARDEFTAGEVALERLDLLRALWNYARTFGSWRISSPTRPVNPILLGPIHTLHGPGGQPIESSIWWEPSYVEPAQLPQISERDFTKLRDSERAIRNAIGRSHLRGLLRRFFVRYVRALDERNLSSAFLKLWSVLEDLTNTGRSRYDLTIRRATFICEDRALHRRLLEHLRGVRNRIAHEGYESDDSERILYQLKVYVDYLLRLLLRHRRLFRSMDDVGQFLDAPVDRGTLKRRIALYDAARVFRHAPAPRSRS